MRPRSRNPPVANAGRRAPVAVATTISLVVVGLLGVPTACTSTCTEAACGPESYWDGVTCKPLPSLGEGVLVIGAGCFEMGCDPNLGDDAQPDCKLDAPVHTVFLDPFAILEYEVTVGRYRECVDDGGCVSPSLANAEMNPYCNWTAAGREQHPMNCITREAASTYCEWAGMRLPSEAEWEKAARGTDARIFPWGGEGSCESAVVCKFDATEPVNSPGNDADSSFYGVRGVGGNVSEWVSDMYVDDFYGSSSDAEPAVNPVASSPVHERDPVLFRGGSFQDARPFPAYVRFSGVSTHVYDHTIGFRCARGV